MPEYPVKSPVRYGGKKHMNGTVKMDADIARPLVTAGVLGEASESQNSKGNDDKPKTQIASIVEAIGKLDTNKVPEHYGKNKKPQVKAIEELLKADITGAQRDEAFALLNK